MFRLLLLSCQAKRPWEYDTPEERRVETEEIKEKGNTYFKAGKYTLALRQYDRASDNVGEDALSQSDEFKERKGLRISLHLNQAACHLKLQAPAAAIKECEEVRGGGGGGGVIQKVVAECVRGEGV